MSTLTDILIPLGKGSRQNDLELRFCLRSIEKHLKGVGNVWIVGEKPEWLQNVIHVTCKDNPNTWKRAENIYRKIMAGIGFSYCDFEKTVRLSDNFLFMNDDHFLLQDYVAGEFPYYHRGEIDLQSMASNMPQFKQMRNTVTELNTTDFVFDFDIHSPIVYNKRLFKKVFERLDWPEYGYGIKSFYCNHGFYLTQWVSCEDLKFSQPAMKEVIYQLIDGRGWFSVGDRTLKSGDMVDVLKELYPNKSKYEV